MGARTGAGFLVVAAQPVVDQQSHHVAVPGGALLVGPAAGRLLSGRAAAGGGGQELGVGGGAELPRLLLRGLEGETLEVSDRAVCAAERDVSAGLLGVDLPQHHQAQDDQPALGLALLRRGEVHADFSWVHDPGAALLGPDRHVGAHGRGLGRYPLEGEDLGLRAARRHPGEAEALLRNRQSDAVGPPLPNQGRRQVIRSNRRRKKKGNFMSLFQNQRNLK
ncbi:hypothetical protein INR49_011503 [Caranx melampygus]|nr:hypothetical protein INR49_011503 [Caranx melampygus]